MSRWQHWSGRLAPLGALARPQLPAAIVLGYHGLRPDGSPPDWLRVPVSVFVAHLRALAGLGRIVGPEALERPEALAADRLHFLLTFDDGYADNHALLLPVLCREDVAAAVFVSTAHLESGEAFWFDRVVTPLLHAPPAEVDLRPFGLGRHPLGAGSRPPRWEAIQAVLDDMKTIEGRDPDRWAAALAWFDGLLPADGRDLVPRPLRPEELRELRDSGRVRVESHAHEHRILTRLADRELAASLDRSRAVLAGVLDEAPTWLAYPNGDRDARVEAAATAAGYVRGFTVEKRPWRPAADVPLRTPRLLVGGFDSVGVLRYKLARLLLAAR